MSGYRRNIVPNDPKDLPEFLARELERLESLQPEQPNVRGIEFEVLTSEPVTKRTGLVVYADGTQWNPGFGEGLYQYLSNGSWNKL